MPRTITSATSLGTLRKEAKRWLRALRAGDEEVRARLLRVHPHAPAVPTLRDVQHALAREHQQEDWLALRAALLITADSGSVLPPPLRPVAAYDQLANDLVNAFEASDEASLQRLNAHYERSFTFGDLGAEIWRRVYAFRQRASRGAPRGLEPAEARMVIAQDTGFGSWEALAQAVTTGAPRVPAHEVDAAIDGISPRRYLSGREWEALLAVMQERRLAVLEANGLMTDEVMPRLAGLDHVTTLKLGGSRQLTDEGLAHLARMPQLEHLELSGAAITDRGLDVLRHLPNLRSFHLNWQRGITDAGVANLRFCDRLERVDLMGSPTGDGAIEALQGKASLRALSTGTLVTDAGLLLLHHFPRLSAWDADAGAELLLDGPFTDAGMAGLSGLDGVGSLDLFWHVRQVTASGLAHLIALANLRALGADGKLSDDAAMAHYAAMPRLRKLRAQGTVATDAGFEALSRSHTLESLWGRECPNLGSRGFVALASMPALRGLGVSCKNVDDEALAALPHFPALRELTPIDVTDAGFRHVGGCERLERLTCMYCRDTSDTATGHIACLPLRYYYAGLTQITDRSLEVLGGMATLEQVELYECRGVTDAGLPFLRALPRLREVHLDSLPGVTLQGTRVFPAHVRVKYST